MLMCATQSFPPSLSHSIHPSHNHLLQKNNHIISTHYPQKFKKFHQHSITAKQSPMLFNLYLQFYVNNGLMDKAQDLFHEMPERTLVSWTILMSGYTRHGPANETLLIFQKMVYDHGNVSIQPDSFVYGIVLRACSILKNLEFGREIHSRVLKCNGVMDSFVENALVMMYSKCGSVEDCARVFDSILQPDLVAWSSLLNGYLQNGFIEHGLKLYIAMVQSGIKPDAFALSMVISASSNLGILDFGIQIHCCIIKMGFCSCLFLENSLMDFYAKCGDLGSLEKVFDELSETNLVSWNTIIKGFAQNHRNCEALSLFRDLMSEFRYCDDFTLPSVLQAITSVGALGHGREVHGYIIRAGFESNVYVISSLIDMYIECVDFASSHYQMEVPLKIFNRLNRTEYDEFIMASILKWCSLQFDVETGKAIHSIIIKQDLQFDLYLISSLIDMYSKCELLAAARSIFGRVEEKSLVPWSAIIAGNCWNERFEEALRLFRRMQFDGVEANEFIYTSVILASLATSDLRRGKELHCKLIRTGFECNTSVMNILITLYSELYSNQQAMKLCSSIPDEDISWGFLIQSCMKFEDHETIFQIFQRIQEFQGKLDPISASYIINSCANPVLLNVGSQVHAYVIKRGLLSDPFTGNSLIKMYSRCGKISNAMLAFNSMLEKNSDSWTLSISANLDHGHSSFAIQLFDQMRWKKKVPNLTTFTTVLKAYAEMGLVDEAFRLLLIMEETYRIEPATEHYTSIVEALGRAGMFEEAQEFIKVVFRFEPAPLVWKTLLSACRIHNNMKVAKFVAEKLLELEQTNISANLLLKHVLLSEGNWDDASKIKINTDLKRTSSSSIEIKNKIYDFISDQIPTEIMSSKLAEIERVMEELGYVPDKHHLLHNLEEEEYAASGLYHTEMKALAFGLISLSPGVAIRILKSIRMCGDCHSAFKFMSTFLDRELVVKDSCKYHNFKNGKCSCRDSW